MAEQAVVITVPYVLDSELPGYVDPTFITAAIGFVSCDRCGATIAQSDYWLRLHVAYHREVVKVIAGMQRSAVRSEP